MGAVTFKHFDVLDYVENAAKAGINEEAAKFHARQLEQLETVIESRVQGLLQEKEKTLATKKDLIESAARLGLKIAKLRVKLIK